MTKVSDSMLSLAEFSFEAAFVETSISDTIKPVWKTFPGSRSGKVEA